MDTPILLFLFILLSKNNEIQNVDAPLHKIKNYVNNMEIDYKYTREKIKIANKLRPYVPNDYIKTYDKSLIVTEKLIKIVEVLDYINTLEIVEVEPMDLPPIEKLQHIVNIVQEEAKNSKVENLGMILDLLVNMDNYKKVFNILTATMKDKKSLNDPNTLIKLTDTFMEGKSDKDKEKIKEMAKMLELFTMLDIPSDSKSNPNES